MKPSLFSQSLFALSLEDAIQTTARVGFPAIEVACKEPHFSFDRAVNGPELVVSQIQQAGLKTSALSLFSSFTDAQNLEAQIKQATTFIQLAPLFETEVVKVTPGAPASAEATETHWSCLRSALDALVPVAEQLGVKLAFETHMRQLTDTLAGSQRLLELAPSEVVGLTVDFSNLVFADESMPKVFDVLGDRIQNTHLKNGTVGADGRWHFHALDQGWTDYGDVIHRLRQIGYDGYLTIECLGPDTRERPAETARRDLDILKRTLNEGQRQEEA